MTTSDKLYEYNAVIPWLLEENDPSMRLRTLTGLMDLDDDSHEVRRAKAAVLESLPVRHIMERMHPDGYWLQKVPHKRISVGDGVVYGSFASTHFCLAYLAELGLDRTQAWVEKAAGRYLNLLQPDGDWLGHYSCLLGYNIRTFIQMGYRGDERLQRAIGLMLTTPRQDGGYLCDFHEGKYKTREVRSCIRGSVKCLLAFADLPEYWDHPRCRQLVEYFLHRGGVYQSRHPTNFVNQDMHRLSFPITWRTNLWEVLFALSKMGQGGDARLDSAWSALESRSDDIGRYPLDWTPAQCPWNVGRRDEVNKWITYYVLLARKYAQSTLGA